jgi:peptide/nickel transport system permease protein
LPELAITGPSAGRVAWQRRRQTLASHWSSLRHNRGALLGLAVIVFFVVLAIFEPLIVSSAQLDPAAANGPLLHAPDAHYPLGTDNFGRSVLALMVSGARISMIVGFAATLGAMLIGASVGVLAGYYSGTAVDSLLDSVINWFLAIPWVVLAVVLAAILGPTLLNIILVIALTSWATTARLVRAQVLTVKERLYVERSRALGAGGWFVVTRHILPNVMSLILANATLTVALAILAETTLSVLGLGDPTQISWGRIIEQAFANGAISGGYWWWLVPPGLAIVVVTLAFTLCGYGIEDIVEPALAAEQR